MAHTQCRYQNKSSDIRLSEQLLVGGQGVSYTRTQCWYLNYLVKNVIGDSDSNMKG